MWFSCALVLLRLFPFFLVLMKLALSWGLRASLLSFVGSVCFIIVSYSVFVLFRFCFFLSLLICCTACCITSVCCLHKTVLSTRRRPAHPVSALILHPRDTRSVVTKPRHRQLRCTRQTAVVQCHATICIRHLPKETKERQIHKKAMSRMMYTCLPPKRSYKLLETYFP